MESYHKIIEQYQAALGHCNEQIAYWKVNVDPTEKQLPMYEELKEELERTLATAISDNAILSSENPDLSLLSNAGWKDLPQMGKSVTKEGYR